MAIRGSLREASLPDVLQLLAMGKKTGCLSVTHRQSFGNIWFDKGRISYASIVNRRDRLGDILVMNGLITRDELDAAIAEQSSQSDTRLGEILVAHARIAREDLHRFIKLQIEEAVYFLFTWTQGSFTFDADVAPEAQDFLVSINPESLLLEGARRIDEWSLIEKRVPSFDIVFAIDRTHLDESNVALTPEQEAIVPLIDGTRDVTALIDASGLGEFDVGKALFALVTAGFVHRVGRSKAPEAQSSDARVAEHRNLGIAFYKTAMFDEAEREFRRVLELRASDAHAEFFCGLVAVRQSRWDEAITTFRRASERPGAKTAIYCNLAFALERVGRDADALVAIGEAERLAPNDATVRLAAGVLAVRRGDVVAAEQHLLEARGLWGKRVAPAAWFHYAALAAALRGALDRALDILAEGTTAHPHAAALLNNLAAAMERRGRHAEAAVAAERGSIEDPSIPQLHKNLGDAHYRAGRYDDALESYLRGVRTHPDLGGDVYLKMGNIRYRRRERDEAARCWEHALALDPANSIARNNLDALQTLA